jgi:hypothetical protein
MLDFNNVKPSEKASTDFELIPDGTIAPVVFNIQKIAPTAAGDKQGMSVEFTILEGPYARRKFWGWMGISGSEQMVDITMRTVREMLESAYGFSKTDESPEALAARTVEDWQDLAGLEFLACIGIEKGTNGYSDKNKLKYAVAPTSPDYTGFTPAKVKASAPSAPAQAAQSNGSRPAWA